MFIVSFLGAAVFEKLALNRLHDFNQNGFSDWKRSFIGSRASNEVKDIHTHMDALDGRRSILVNGGEISRDASDIMLETANVCIFKQFISNTTCRYHRFSIRVPRNLYWEDKRISKTYGTH